MMITKELQTKKKSPRPGLAWALMIPIFGIMALAASQTSQADELAEKGTALAEKYCFKCHGGEASKGDEDFNILNHKSLTEHDNEYVTKGDLGSSYMWERISDGDMPPRKAPQPTEEEIATFKAWISAGAPIYVSTDAPAAEAPATKSATAPTPAEMPATRAVQGTQQPGLPPAPFGNEPSIKSVPGAGQPAAGQVALPGGIDLATEGKRILDQYCGKCHPGKGNPEFDPSNREVMIASAEKLLVPGNVEGSFIWEQVAGDFMPPRSAVRKNQAVYVTPEDKEILKQWILAGAPYPEAQPRGAYISQAQVWDWAFNDLRGIPELDRPYVRYFQMDNVYNNYMRYNNDEYIAHHAALSKVCNSLSQESAIVPPYQVQGSQGTLWRIDLRDYGWDGLAYDGCNIPRYSAWKLLIAKYPYGLSYDQHADQRFRTNYSDVLRQTRSAMPILRADWFIFNATQDDLYYLINRIPSTDRHLEKLLGVDIKGDFMRKRLLRSGVVNSGISVSNRLMDRHQGRDGYYWKSYDFAINAERNDLTQFPLGPVFDGHPYPDSAFDQDGGEMIYNLPNGMQAYMLIDGKGNRIERGPATVVGDSEWTSGTPEVANAISCMNCHAAGMRMYGDNIRENIAVFGDQKLFAEQLFDTGNKLNAVLNQDSSAFKKACFRCYEGVVDKVPEAYFKPGSEPVAVVAKGFWKELSAIDVGFEIGIAPPNQDIEQLGVMTMGRIQGNIDLHTAGLRPLIRPQGRVRREIWDRMDGFGDYSLFQDTCTAFNLSNGRDCSTSDAVKIFKAYENGTEFKFGH